MSKEGSVILGMTILLSTDTVADVAKDITTATAFVRGDHDDDVKAALTTVANEHYASGLIPLPPCDATVDLALRVHKRRVASWVKILTRTNDMARRAQVASNFRSMNTPAPEGTVAELAERYGKSKSEIRRLKAAGELHTLTAGS